MLSTTIAGRYRIEHEIARGGMASVWLATDEVLSRPVAVKILHANLAADEVFVERFRREARAAAGLAHPNIVSVFDTGEHDGQPFIVMEYLRGGTLRDRLADGGAIEVSEAAAIGAEVAEALGHAHDAGVVHRDVKPGNILFSESAHVKVGDFGIAKAAFESTALTETGTILGTIRYVAPEVLEGREPDARADIYSLGVVLYEATTGRPPFEGENDLAAAMARLESAPPRPRDLRPDLSRDVDDIIMRALARSPDRRFRDVREMGRLLAAVSDRAEVQVIRPPRQRPSEEATVETSFVRSEARWLLPTVLILALAAVLVAAVLQLTGGVQLPRIGLAPGPPTPEGGREVRLTAAGTYDPEGGGDERGDLVGRATDGKADTAWKTQSYTRANFGGLKAGVGIWVQVDRPERVRRIEVVSVDGGWRGTIRHSDDARSWSEPGASRTVERREIFEAPPGHRFYMVWITELVRTPGQGGGRTPFSVGISEIRALG